MWYGAIYTQKGESNHKTINKIVWVDNSAARVIVKNLIWKCTEEMVSG